MDQCISDSELRQLLSDDRELSSDWSRAIEHLSHCENCVLRLENLSVAAQPDLQRSWLNRSIGPEGFNLKQLEKLSFALPLTEQNGRSHDDTPSLESSPNAKSFGELGKYQLVEKIGHGGMGSVYRAIDKKLNRTVAIKLVSNRFEAFNAALIGHEANAGARVEHPNVIPVFSIESHEDQTFFVMQYIEGPSLSTYIRDNQPMNPRYVAQIIAQVADGLQAAHEHGIIHRDVKPANIMLDQKSGLAKIGDFGLAIAIENQTGKNSAGTPGYVSPELEAGNPPSVQSDVFGLGVTLFQALAGQLTFDLNAKDNTQLATDLHAIVGKATHDDPKARYQSMQAFSLDLRNWLNGEPVLARPENFLERFQRHVVKRRLWWSAASVMVVAVLGGRMLVTNQNQLTQLETEHEKSLHDLAAAETDIDKQTETIKFHRKARALEAIEYSKIDPNETIADKDARFHEIIVKITENKLRQIEKEKDPVKKLDFYIRAANDFRRGNDHLKALSSLEKAIGLARQANFGSLEPMTQFRILRGCRTAAELNLECGRLDSATLVLDNFDKLAARAKTPEKEFGQRTALHIAFSRILRSKLYAHENKLAAAIVELDSLGDLIREQEELDYSIVFKSNKHRVELNYKLALAYWLAKDEQQAADVIERAALLFPNCEAEKLVFPKTSLRTWQEATRQLLKVDAFELADRANRKVVEILEAWEADTDELDYVNQSLDAAKQLGTRLDSLIDFPAANNRK